MSLGLSKIQVAVVRTAKAFGATDQEAARAAGVTKETVSSLMRLNHFARQVEQIKKGANGIVNSVEMFE